MFIGILSSRASQKIPPANSSLREIATFYIAFRKTMFNEESGTAISNIIQTDRHTSVSFES